MPESAAGGASAPVRNAPRTYQAYHNQASFASVTQPVLVTGMQFRLAAGAASGVSGATWPSQPLTFNNYDVQLSRGSADVQTAGGFTIPDAPAAAPTFAANQGGTVTTTRSGPLTVPAGSFPNAGIAAPNPYGLLISFSTPYLYTPGEELVLTVRHDGYMPGSEPQAFLAVADYAPNVADAVSSVGFTTTAPDGFSDPVFVQYTFAPVPEPGLTLAAAGVACLAVLRRGFGRACRISPHAECPPAHAVS